jgi:hypothetical protein
LISISGVEYLAEVSERCKLCHVDCHEILKR